MSKEKKRTRMIVDLTKEVQMAIRLHAVKRGMNYGEVVEAAVKEVFPDDVQEAQTILAAEKAEKKHA